MRPAIAPSATPGTEGQVSSRRLDIQGLRAIAVLMVVGFHAGLPLPGGFTGVDVFFVISGFVITAMLEREWKQSQRIDLKQFYLRRYKRLSPALAVTLATTLLIGLVALSPFGTQQVAARTALGAMAFAANIAIAQTSGGYFDGPAESNPLLNTWSLSVEEQFYLFFPALLLLAWTQGRRRGNARRAGQWLVAAVSGGSLVLALAWEPSGSRMQEVVAGFYSPIARIWEFGAGACLALVSRPATLRRPRVSFGLAFVGLGLLVASAVGINGSSRFPGPWTLVPVVGTVLLICAGDAKPNPITNLLASRQLVRIGDWSYSIYLWHWPFIVFGSTLWPEAEHAKAAGAVLSVIPALASYRWVEEPLRTASVNARIGLARLVAATAFPPLLASVLVFALTRPSLQPESRTAVFRAITTMHAPSERGCLSRMGKDEKDISKCLWNAEWSDHTPVYLVGDSQAWHFSEALIDATRETKNPLWIFTAPSCPLVDGVVVSARERSEFFPGAWPASEFTHCAAYKQFAFEWLGSARPGVVVIAGFDQYWWDPSLAVQFNEEAEVRSEEDKAEVLRRSLTVTVNKIGARGHKVILVQALPNFRNPGPIWDPRTCSNLSILQGSCGRTIMIRDVDRIQRLSRNALASAARETGADVVDLRSRICSERECSTNRNGEWWYMDATHITVAASTALSTDFSKTLRRLLPSPEEDR